MFGEKVKRREKLRLGVSAADAESSMDQFQQTCSLRKHGMGFIQPLRQIKLQGKRDRSGHCNWHVVCGVYIPFLHSTCTWTNLSEQHENDIGAVEGQRCHDVLVEKHQLTGRCVGSEEGGNERAKPPLLHDSLQDTATLLCISLDKYLHTKLNTL